MKIWQTLPQFPPLYTADSALWADPRLAWRTIGVVAGNGLAPASLEGSGMISEHEADPKFSERILRPELNEQDVVFPIVECGQSYVISFDPRTHEMVTETSADGVNQVTVRPRH